MAEEKTQKELVEAELRKLKKAGLLKPEKIVEFARDPKTALHSKFEWDNSKAGHEYRLWQARELIVTVKILPRGATKPIQAFVSLKSDRSNPGGGYRELVSVLGNKELRAELLKQAMADFHYWKQKYQQLNELVPIFDAAAQVEQSANKKKSAVA